MAAVLLALTCLAATATARDIFVNNQSGDDHATGRSMGYEVAELAPVRSIAKAVRLAQMGDRIVLANTGTPYHESVRLSGLRLGAGILGPLTIEGNGAIMDGSAPVPPGAWQSLPNQTFRFQPPRLGWQQLYLHGRPLPRRPIEIRPGKTPALEPLEWCFANGSIYFRVEDGKLPDDYEPACAELPVAISLYQVSGVTIQNLILQGYQLDGISAHDAAFDIQLIGVTCRGNARSGVSVAGSSRVLIDRCLLGDNGTAQLRTEGYSHTHVTDSQLLDNSADALVQAGGEVKIDQPAAK